MILAMMKLLAAIPMSRYLMETADHATCLTWKVSALVFLLSFKASMHVFLEKFLAFPMHFFTNRIKL